MKKIFIQLMVVLVSGLLFTACDGDSTANVSKVTYYPNLTMHGDALVVLTQGDTYTEKGVDAEANGQPLEVKISGSVDTSKPTVYKINYSALNNDGFPATLTRTVVVLSNQPSTINLEGVFTRGANVNNVKRLADRKYICDNATGYNVANDYITLEFYNIDDKQIYAPYAENTSKSGLSAESNIGTITDKNNWKWVIYASAVFGTAERIFKR